MKAKLRPAQKSDVPWITSAWGKSARHSPMFKGISNTVFYHHYQKMMEHVLPRAAVVVYCWDDPDIPDDRSNIGFIVYEKTPTSLLVHFVYVKDLYRKRGFAQRLYEAVSTLENRNHVIYTMVNTRMTRHDMYEKLQDKGWLYQPWELWRPPWISSE